MFRTYSYLLVTVFLAVFIKFWEPGIGNSAACYGAIARNLAQDGRLFHLHLAPGIFDPFVEHPPLVIWLDAFIFKLFGSSSQTIRLLSSLAALWVFSAVFFISKRYFNEKVAVLSVLSLLTVNVFMNYTSSGWLDLPMVGIVWAGVYAAFTGVEEQNDLLILIGGFFWGLAVVAKGVSALSIFPPFFFVFFKLIRKKKFGLPAGLVIAGFIPVLIFTAAHYSAEGFIFWKAYLSRELFQNAGPSHLRFGDYFWHIKKTLQFGHVVSILGLAGAYKLWKKDNKDWSLLILGEVAIHSLGYSWSSRHYSQYTVPSFPWLAIGAGYSISEKLRNFHPLKVAKGAALLVTLLFVVIDLFPIRVHSGNENPFRPMMPALREMKDNRHMYFVGREEDQETWEDPASYIVWYWDRVPVLSSFDQLLIHVDHSDPDSLGVVSTSLLEKTPDVLVPYKNIEVCFWNDQISVVAPKSLCDQKLKGHRPRELPRGGYEQAP